MSKLYVGVDWHKRTSTWVAIDEHRNQVYQRSWGCSPAEVEAAIASLPAPPLDITLGVEPVCGWRWMSDLCDDSGIDTRIANPKRLREIANTAKKTDKQDAHTIAELLRMGYLPEAYKAPDDIQSLRVLVRQRGFFVRLRTATKCRIHGVCTALGAHETADRPLHQAGRTKLRQGDNAELRDLYGLLDEIMVHIRAVEQKLNAITTTSNTYKILMSIPGIGPITATALYAEIGDFTRFPSPAALISYAGIYPKERSSGEQRRLGGMSKAGNRLLRYNLIEAAMRVREKDGSRNLFSHYQAAVRKRKKTPKQARVVLAHKMLTIAWYVVTRGVHYDDRAVQPAQREMTS